jgi:hypothetical protein
MLKRKCAQSKIKQIASMTANLRIGFKNQTNTDNYMLQICICNSAIYKCCIEKAEKALRRINKKNTH